jgi:hypothetical protein
MFPLLLVNQADPKPAVSSETTGVLMTFVKPLKCLAGYEFRDGLVAEGTQGTANRETLGSIPGRGLHLTQQPAHDLEDGVVGPVIQAILLLVGASVLAAACSSLMASLRANRDMIGLMSFSLPLAAMGSTLLVLFTALE